MNPEGVQAQCAICNLKTHRRCSQCLSIYYCNKLHQKQDWKRHRSECVPKLTKQGSNKDTVNRALQNEESAKNESVQPVNVNTVEVSEKKDFPKPEISASATRRSKKSKKKSVLKEGSDTVTDNKNTSQVSTEDISVRKQSASDTSEVVAKGQPAKDSVISSVVYTNSDLSKESAITYEGSSEKEILSESAQLLNTEDFAMASSSNVMRPRTTEFKMPSLPVYNSMKPSRSKEYPEASLKGSAAPFNNLPATYVMDSSDPYYEICHRVIRDMTQYGVCVLDNFLGKERGLKVLNEVLEMYKSGIFTAGQTMSSPGSCTEVRTVRSDRITWIDGKETHTQNISKLISQVDNIVLRANKMANNGRMGDYIINNRTMAMVACYPGSGTHYVKHVDNPNKDGRCITAIYYLNLDWDVKRHGGLLRVFPEGTNQVADIAPIFDRMLFFWSDRRNPHEVQPAFNTRYAITLWYFDAQEREEALRRHYDKHFKHASKRPTQPPGTTKT